MVTVIITVLIMVVLKIVIVEVVIIDVMVIVVVSRGRLFDSACSGAHPTSTKMPKLPLHKTIYPKAYCDGRFENEPTHVPHPKLLIGKDRWCKCSDTLPFEEGVRP